MHISHLRAESPLVNRRVISLTLVIMIHATAVVIEFSKSLASRRLRCTVTAVPGCTVGKSYRPDQLAVLPLDHLTGQALQTHAAAVNITARPRSARNKPPSGDPDPGVVVQSRDFDHVRLRRSGIRRLLIPTLRPTRENGHKRFTIRKVGGPER